MNVALGLSDGFDLNMGKTSFSDFCKYYPQVDSLESTNMIKQEFGEKPRIWADLVFIYVYAGPRTGNKDGKIEDYIVKGIKVILLSECLYSDVMKYVIMCE